MTKGQLAAVMQRFDQLDGKLLEHDKRFDRIDRRLVRIEKRHDIDDRGLRIEHDDDELVVVDYYGDEQGRHDEAELDR